MRVYFDPPRSVDVVIQDRNGRRLSKAEINDLANRRVKWARRTGPSVVVMLEGTEKGEEGILLRFPVPSQYDTAVRRVFTPAAV